MLMLSVTRPLQLPCLENQMLILSIKTKCLVQEEVICCVCLIIPEILVAKGTEVIRLRV